MRRLDEAMSDLIERRRAEGPDYLIDVLRRRLAGEAEVIVLPERTDVDRPRTRSLGRGPLIAVGALVGALLIAVPILWLGGGDESSVGATPAPTVAALPITTVAPATTITPTTVLASHLEPAPLQLGDEIGFSQSGDTLWAWDGEGGVAGYCDGAWQTLSPLPDAVRDVAGTLNGPVWALTDGSLWYLEDGDWRTLPQEAALPIEMGIDVARVEVDATGIVWVLVGADLYRWDGIEMTQVVSAPDGSILDDFVVAGNGTIWERAATSTSRSLTGWSASIQPPGLGCPFVPSEEPKTSPPRLLSPRAATCGRRSPIPRGCPCWHISIRLPVIGPRIVCIAVEATWSPTTRSCGSNRRLS